MRAISRRTAISTLVAASTPWAPGCGGGAESEGQTESRADADAPRVPPPVRAPATWPKWRAEMTPNTWRSVPMRESMLSLDPNANPAINPNYPNASTWYGNGFHQWTNCWSGGCYDRDRDVFWAILTGGHGGYLGNAPWKLELDLELPKWTMLRNPSGGYPNPFSILTTDQADSPALYHTGRYYDGRIRATHTYNKQVYVPGSGPWFGYVGHGSGYSGAPSTSVGAALVNCRPYRLDEVTGEGQFYAVNTFVPGDLSVYSQLRLDMDVNGACYDSLRHRIWCMPKGWLNIYYYDVALNSWGRSPVQKQGGSEISTCYVPGQDLIVMIAGVDWSGNMPSGQLQLYDPSVQQFFTPTISGQTAWTSALAGAHQINWAAELGAFYFWDEPAQRERIRRLTPPAGDWRTGTWTFDYLIPTGGNKVVPSARAQWGTFGRFQYSPKLRGFMLFNRASDDVYFYAIA